MDAAVRWVRLGVALLLILGAYALVPTRLSADSSTGVRLFGLLLLLVGSAAVMIRQMRLSAIDGNRAIDGLVLAVVIMTLTFAILFQVLEERDPGQVPGLDTRLDALYFTVSTMLTVGFGDIHAQGQAARALVLVQMIFDVVFIATAAGMLSSRVRRAADARRAARGVTDPASSGNPTTSESDRG
jgi:voltage-gated potassium channel